MPGRILTALLVLLFNTGLFADPQVINHQISFENRRNQYADVRLTLPVQSSSVDLVMPNWTPGSYLIREYAAHVESLQARGHSGKALQVTKIEKNQWRIATAGEQQIDVSYAVWSGELAANAAWIENDFAILNGAALFLYNENIRHLPQRLSIVLPDSWRNAHVALPQAKPGDEYLARDFDELIDSPILLGNTTNYPFALDGQEYELISQGDGRLWDMGKAADDLEKLVKSVQSFWQVNPLERKYLFMNIIAPGQGGLEHDYSTFVLSSPWQMRFRGDYIRWLSLLAHEFFHVWNVRRLRPQAFSKYEYNQETYSRELWLVEGLSSYYDNLLLFRSGLITVDEYLALLSDEILKYESAPGRKVRSAEQSSFDAWIKHYKPDANTINSDVSYYRRGSLIGFVADQKIRQATGGEFSLDDVMRELYRQYGVGSENPGGFPPRAFESLIEQLAGKKISQEIEDLLTSVSDPDVDSVLEFYGLQLDRQPGRQAAEAAGGPIPTDFGAVWNTTQPMLLIESVIRGSTGAEAGLLPGDELLAINNHRVDRFNIQDRLLRLQPGEEVELLLARNARVLTLPVKMQHAMPDKYRIGIKPDIGNREKKRMQEWLGLRLIFKPN